MMKLAIVGAGVAGLGCAHFLHSRFEITLFEQNGYAGGHTNTVTVQEDGLAVPIDTGFMVYNEVTYPNLTRLFRELDVATKPASMSFSVQHRPSGIEYNGAGLAKLFAQRRNLARPRFWRLLRQMNRFNSEAVSALEDPGYAEHTVGRYVAERGYGDDFLNLFLVPMSSAIWSTPREKTLDFPAVTLLRFFHNHGFLGLHTHHPWRTLEGGAQCYVAKMKAPWASRVALNAPVVQVARPRGKAIVTMADGSCAIFDKVIMAAHADETLRLLADPTDREARLLSEFRYQPNMATLHTECAIMPRRRRCWASWNYRIAEDGAATTHYWMNSLQGISRKRDYFVSLNAEDSLPPEKVLRRIPYTHPLFSLGAIAAQRDLPALNRLSPDQTTYYCGSYFKYGFHEDAFTSALECARAVTGEGIWS
ncbi:MAG TPA: FAD-dependent oxidoreductase [Chthoniobacteraceae bacterium]|jgi:predicted NAD/FAD-binding protein|nr:FAD-dependent oxidoreductase [Chthoniobacteraceae bacterium]